MSHANAPQRPLDVLRKAVVVATLVGGIVGLHRLAVPTDAFDPRGLLALGFLTLAAYTIGELAGVVRLPSLTGYLLAGVAFGPSMAHLLHGRVPEPFLVPPLDEGIVSARVLSQLGPVDALALALIALSAGGELKASELRQGATQLAGMVVGMVGTTVVTATVFLAIVGTVFPGAVPALAGLDGPSTMAVALAMGVLAAATSPGVAIAVVTSVGARGPVSRAVLASVVAGEVSVVLLFSAAVSLVLAVLGAAGEVSVLDTLVAVALSVVVGAVVGAVLALYLRYVAVDVPLFLVGLVYAATFALQELHGEAALAFVAAGFVVGNLTRHGEALIHQIELISKPVYVVFFTLAGAKLHLDLLAAMLLPTLGLFLVRFASVYFGARAGARVTGAPDAIHRYVWMGLVSQAGMAIALAGQARTVLPGEIGQGVYAMAIALITVNELVGPTVLQSGLRAAGEIPGTPGAAVAEPHDAREPAPDGRAGFGTPVPTGDPELDAHLADLEARLREIVAAETAPLAELARAGEARLRVLRRELLRVLKRAADRPGPDLGPALRADVGEVTDRWRDVVRELPIESGWSPQALVDAVDRALAPLPVALVVPVPDAVVAPRPEPRWRALRRALLRLHRRWIWARREVPLRSLARYHLSGRVPSRLEPLAALLVATDERTARRVAEIADAVGAGFEACARLADAGAPPERVRAELERVRADAERAFQEALEELAAASAEASRRAARAVGGALQDVRRDAALVGTLDLPHRLRRYGRVFAERNRGVALVTTGLADARRALEARFSLLALELELVGLAGRARDTVRAHGTSLAGRVRERGSSQLRLVDEAVGGWLGRAGELLDAGPPADALARLLREGAEPMLQRLREARARVEQLDRELADEAWVARLADAVLRHAQDTTESAVVPAGPIASDDRRLPPPPGTIVVPLRELVAAVIESRVTRDLHDLTEAIEADVREMGATLGELERVVTFNLGLAIAEVDGRGAAPIPAQALELVRAMLVGAIGRTHHRLRRGVDAVEGRSAGIEDRVHAAVVGQLEELRRTIALGRAAELRAVWLVEGRMALARRAERWRGLVPEARERAHGALERALGADRIVAVRAALGLAAAGGAPLRRALAPPEPPIEVPVLYRRLFADVPFEAGDLLAGRQEELARLRAALAPGGRLRSAAVIGLDPHSARALVTSAVRGALDGTRWFDAGGPAGEDVVEGWLASLEGLRDHAIVIENLRWLFARRPGGFAPIERLVRAILEDGGRNGFVLVADGGVWRYLARATGVEHATADVVELGPLTVDELERAVLSRHAMSGYEVAFDAGPDVLHPLRAALPRRHEDERPRKAWFRAVHRASAGVLQDALRLWMASVREVDDAAERIRLGPVPAPPLARLAELPEDALLALLETTRQGWTSAEQHARLFRTPVHDADARLAALAHAGLLVPAGAGLLRIAPHLRGPIDRVLQQRGWT